jgi:hypothetical protein
VAATPVQAEILLPGEYRGVVVFDRWGSCVLSDGPHVMWVSERIKDSLRPFDGRPLIVHATAIRQPVNPGDGCIMKLASRWGTVPPAVGETIRVNVTPELKPPQPPAMLVSIENTSRENIEFDSEIGFTVLMRKPDRPDFFTRTCNVTAAMSTSPGHFDLLN